MSKIVITGGAGMIGRALTQAFAAMGDEVVILTRQLTHAKRLPQGARAVTWDGVTGRSWFHELTHATAIINLAGETIGKPFWTAARKQRIHASRVNAGKAIVDALRCAGVKPPVLIQMSGVGYYGLHDDEIIAEDGAAGKDFLASVCVDWEGATAEAERFGVRRIITRTGVVLSREGGALPLMALPFWFGAGGPLGSGRQYLPWIHIADVVKGFRFLIEHDGASGVVNLCAPNPVTNKQFVRALGRAMSRPAFLPAPGFALKLALGEMAELVLLGGQRVVPKRLTELGYPFQFSDVEKALRNLYNNEEE
jgi:uncharacterized protein (TIGR01777 family)